MFKQCEHQIINKLSRRWLINDFGWFIVHRADWLDSVMLGLRSNIKVEPEAELPFDSDGRSNEVVGNNRVDTLERHWSICQN